MSKSNNVAFKALKAATAFSKLTYTSMYILGVPNYVKINLHLYTPQIPSKYKQWTNAIKEIYKHKYINSHLFPMVVGRKYRTPPVTILTYSYKHSSCEYYTPDLSIERHQ